MIEDVQYVSN